MHVFTGTWRLVRLALRRDRVKLPIVILVLVGVTGPSATSIMELYGGSFQEQVKYAATSAPSVVGRVFSGPLDGPNIGAIVMNEVFLFTAVAVAFMSTMTVVRHTRQNEEAGRSDLIESGVVSRHASLFAALIVTVTANIVLGGLVALTMMSNNLPATGSVAMGAALAAVGITFASMAAIAVQLADSARGANNLSAMAIGVAFLLRGIGDALGSLSPDGLAVKSAFPSWLSPLGWSQQIHPYTQGNWWVFGLLGGLSVILTGVAISFMTKRDIGLGMIATQLGVPTAKKKLLSAFGLSRRLQTGILRGWAAVVIVLGVSYGLVVKEFEDFIADNEQFQEALSEIGGSVTDAFLGIMVSFMAITIAGYGVQALMRMRSEEAGGQVESVLGGSVSRWKWMLSHIGFAVIGVLLLSLITALSMGIAFILASGESWGKLIDIIAATMTQATAVLALMGFVIAVFSTLPRMSIALAWGGFSACLLLMQLGVLLKLPDWVMNISPFTHLPAMPAQDFRLAPVAGLLFAAISLSVIGLVYFNRRDIQVS